MASLCARPGRREQRDFITGHSRPSNTTVTPREDACGESGRRVVRVRAMTTVGLQTGLAVEVGQGSISS